ncbi:MAG TPA: hypothetical protein VIJ38_01675 [Acidobacteriaceae bacterium]
MMQDDDPTIELSLRKVKAYADDADTVELSLCEIQLYFAGLDELSFMPDEQVDCSGTKQCQSNSLDVPDHSWEAGHEPECAIK